MQRWQTWNAQKLPGRAVNRFVKGWLGSSPALTAIEVHRTACIVTHPPGGEDAKQGLINPSNERLAGTRFTPEECWRELHGDPTTGRWDKDLAVYPHQAIDGLVTEFGGEALRIALEAIPADARGHRCPTGGAIATPAFFELTELYSTLIHAVAPFYHHLEPAEWEERTIATYHAAFDASERSGLTTVAVPLLGAGARGAPHEAAIRVAAEAAISWRSAAATDSTLTARFGVQDSSTAHALADALDDALRQSSQAVFSIAPPPPKGRWEL